MGEKAHKPQKNILTVKINFLGPNLFKLYPYCMWILLGLNGFHDESCRPDPGYNLYRQVHDRIKARILEGDK